MNPNPLVALNHFTCAVAARSGASVPAPRRSPAIVSAFAFSESTTPPLRPSHRRATRRRAIARAVKSSALAVARPSRVRPSSSVVVRPRARPPSRAPTSIAPSRASRVVVSRVPRPPRRRRRASFLSASFARVARAPSRARASPSRAMARRRAAQSRRAGARVLCRARFGVRVVAS